MERKSQVQERISQTGVEAKSNESLIRKPYNKRILNFKNKSKVRNNGRSNKKE
jgi:hypothetical protein